MSEQKAGDHELEKEEHGAADEKDREHSFVGKGPISEIGTDPHYIWPSMDYRIEAQDGSSKARKGTLITPHGECPTPVFMPVGTAGSVKGVHQRDLEQDARARFILGNTYHLLLRPGMEVLEEMGGLHRFMGWNGPILTDSGGYQVYSLAAERELSEEGVAFRSHIDGSREFLSPERAIDIQRSIGGDVMMAFDECTPYPSPKEEVERSMELTHRWLERSWERYEKSSPRYGHDQTLFPIVQGGVHPDLRERSARTIASMGAEGNAIGGLSVGEPEEELERMTELCCEILPPERPRYLMGVGTPANLLRSVALGVDMFDCVMPSRNARNGMLFTWDGIINIKNRKWRKDPSLVDPQGSSFVDSSYSKAYLRHLMLSKELLGPMIATLHNLAFYADLMDRAREHIEKGDFGDWSKELAPLLMERR